jgi:endonuclease/exonuclease/phosphatase family metal-dependent hydrolase
MAVEIMAWNVLDALSDEQRARGVLREIGKQRPGAVVLSEAYREGKEQFLDDVVQEMDASGYHTVYGLYEDDDGREDRHGIMGLMRKDSAAAAQPKIISLVTRNAVHLPLLDTERSTETVIDFYGVHLDDRNEQRRMAQAEWLIGAAGLNSRVVIGGDMNALHHDDMRAKALRAIRPIAKRMPSVEPRPDYTPPKLKRIGSLASRLTDMATGSTLQLFEAAGFDDVDPDRQPTKGPFNLDHILVKGPLVYFNQHTHARPPVSDQNKAPLSDHRAISVSVYALPEASASS